MMAADDTTGVRRLRPADNGADVGAIVADPAVFAAAYRNLFEISDGALPFRGGLDAWTTGRVTLSLSRHTSLTLTRTLGRGAESPNRRIVDHVACHQILSGSLEGEGPGGTITASAGDMVLQDLLLGAPHISDIDARADVARESAPFRKAWNPGGQHPSILTVRPAEPEHVRPRHIGAGNILPHVSAAIQRAGASE